ncbi:TetR/AcrR family transcriptional regulator [Jiangella alkaliphila]|uniref:DNA-binding transcriptional regulator, AcrR family n=1 Tax=Jiangella alkaliphila TaxID=419479 RepID=A0A1H2L7Y6_9ACTN|nr:TetR/AcrR family transcriptional regulator [Jiangella alkaliphila]SDU76678.1 DNA-binding transcriptional regulator, AcrR family [Jiangella alkaliphila]
MPVTTGRRADAQRNVAAILDAAAECLVRDPDASVSDIAAAAGVGRVTLYGHFASRTDLVDAVFVRAVARAHEALDAVDLTGDARAALARLVASSWRVIDESRLLLVAAQHALPPERIRELHENPMGRVRSLLERGRAAGVFRFDLPADWLVAVFYTVIHGAADELGAGRLAPDAAADTITATLLAAFTPPGAPVPG